MSSMTWMLSRLATLLACSTPRQAVGSLGTVAARLPRVVGPLRTMATYFVQVVGLRCGGTVL
jgi:hypothetical protein